MNDSSAAPLLEVRKLVKHFPIRGGLFRGVSGQVRAVDNVSFCIEAGQTLGLVGESGCGKSTLGRALLRLHEPTAGQVLLNGEDITALDNTAMTARRRDLQMIFQDPYASLSPRRTVGQTIREPLDVHAVGSPGERQARVRELLTVVGLRPESLTRYPHEFSGGQRQRVGIARALALNPCFIVADEPVSALDVSVQSQVLNLIARLQRDNGIAFLFISHDLAVVQHISHHVGVMYLGRLVELASSEAVYRSPMHPYTQALLSAVPQPDPSRVAARTVLQGDVPSAANPPTGCPFHTRCPVAMAVCREQVPALVDVGGEGSEHLVSCHQHS